MTTTATAQYAPAQVGNGRTAHKVTEQFSTETLCERTVSRVLTAEQAAKMKPCVTCATAEAAAQAEDTTPAEVQEPAAKVEAPAAPAEELEEAPAAEVEEPAEVEQAPAAPAGQVEVTAYTAALEQLYCNGQDNADRTLRVEAPALLDTLATLRRMPRWNAAEERFTVNKVALILATDTTGTRVWVRGEAAPIRVDGTGTPVDENAPAEGGPVDMAAIMTATRLLRRRKEVQRVIDNRTNAMAMSAPAPAPVEEPAPAPQVEEEVTYGKPEWRTLKGIQAPFQLYGSQSGNWFRPAGDRKVCHGFPLEMVRTWTEAGARYAEDAEGKRHSLGGTATRYWIATAA